MSSTLRSAVTLSVLALVVAVMAIWGWKAATAAFPASQKAAPQAACTKTKVVSRIYRKEITVSVFNASGRKGLADSTMGSMERRTFVVGAIGNAPAGVAATTVAVYTTVKDDPRALLVAQQFRPIAKIVVTDQDLGPGIDVVLGAKSKSPRVPAPRFLKLAKPVTTCLDKSTR